MKKIRLFRKILILLAGFMIFGLWIQPPIRVLAQCGDTPADSSCKTCHDQNAPVYGKGEWHDIHASKDCCWNCHGGNTQAQDKDLAHEGMLLNPLQDIYTDCHSCHPDDYQSLAERFGVVLGVSPSSNVPPPKPELVQSGPKDELQLIILPTQEQAAYPVLLWHPEVGLVILTCLALAAIFIIQMRRVQN